LLLPWLVSIEGRRYEYELNVLLSAKQAGVAVRQIPIETVYEDNNKGSHFRPLIDSALIYARLFKIRPVFVCRRDTGLPAAFRFQGNNGQPPCQRRIRKGDKFRVQLFCEQGPGIQGPERKKHAVRAKIFRAGRRYPIPELPAHLASQRYPGHPPFHIEGIDGTHPFFHELYNPGEACVQKQAQGRGKIKGAKGA
jgi:hypothetical protein